MQQIKNIERRVLKIERLLDLCFMLCFMRSLTGVMFYELIVLQHDVLITIRTPLHAIVST